MKIGIIGYGSNGARHYQNLQKFKKEIVVLTRRSDVDGVKCVSTWDDFKAQGNYAAIFITNETAKHLETISKCLEMMPKAIFVEKPFTHNINGLENLVKKIKQSGISVWVGYNFHFFEPLIRIKEIIKSGVLGKIFYMRVSVGQDLTEWRPRDYHLSYSSQKEQGGGVMLDLVHDINYPAWLLDDKLKVENCTIKRISDLDIEVEDWVESLFSTNSGVMISVHQDYVRVPYNRALEIAGSNGTLKWDTDSNRIYVLKKGGEIAIDEIIKFERNDMYEKELNFFIDSMKKDVYFSNIDEAVYDVGLIEKLKKYAGK